MQPLPGETQGQQSTTQEQTTPAQSPLLATAVQVIPAVISPPIPVAQPTAEALQQVNNTLAAVGTVHQQQMMTLQSAIQTRLALIGTNPAGCLAAVTQSVQSVLENSSVCLRTDQACLEQHMANLTSAAWEMAAQSGCTPMPKEDVADAASQPSVSVSGGQFIATTPQEFNQAAQGNHLLQQFQTQYAQLYNTAQSAYDDYTTCLLSSGSSDACAQQAQNAIGAMNMLSMSANAWGGFSGFYVQLPQVVVSHDTISPQTPDTLSTPAFNPLDTLPVGFPPPQINQPGFQPVSITGAPTQPVPQQPVPQPPQQPQPQAGGGCNIATPTLAQVGAMAMKPANGPPVGPVDPNCGVIPITQYASPGVGIFAYAVLTTDGTLWIVPAIGGNPNLLASYSSAPAQGNWQACIPALCGGNQPPPLPPNVNPPAPQPPPPPASSCPPPPPCPKPPTCPTCNNDPCKCKDKKPWDKQWCVFRDAGGNCYQTSPGQGPNNPNDTLIGCASDPGQLAPIMAKCKQQNNPPFGPGAALPASPNTAFWCSMSADVVAPIVTFAPNLFDGTLIGQINNLLANTLPAGTFANNAYNGASTFIKWPVWLLAFIFGNTVNATGLFIYAAQAGMGCSNVMGIALKGYLASLGFFERYVSPVFGKLAIGPNYLDNYICPQQIPSTSEANACYLANSITASMWNTWVSANNDCPAPQQAVLQAARAKENVGDLVQLVRRGLISQDTFKQRIRESGYTQGYEASDFYNLSNQIPPVSELIRMMVRDVTNQTVVDTFNLDASFGDNWQGQLAQWGDQQGISTQYAQYEWRAHWDIPSNTQLFEMFHRYRNLQPGDPLYTDQQTILKALQQNDTLPFWQQRLLGTSFRLVPRSDLIQMTRYGVLTEDELKQHVSQLGYSDDDTKEYLDYLGRRHKLTARTHPYTRLYIQGQISQEQLSERLQADFYTQQEVNDTVSYATGIFKGRQNAQCRDAIRKRFFLGELQANDVQAQLTQLGYDANEVQTYISTWSCVRAAKLKHGTAAMLCKWAKQGIIGLDQMTQQLLNIGYDVSAVTNIVGSCQFDIQKAADAKKAKQLKAEQEAAAKAAALAAKLAKQAQGKQQQQQDIAAQMQKAAIAVQKAIIKAAEKWARGCGGDITAIMGQIADAILWMQSFTTLTPDEQLQAVIEAASLMDGKQSCDWPTVYAGVANAWQSSTSLSPGPSDAGTVNTVATSNSPANSGGIAPNIVK